MPRPKGTKKFKQNTEWLRIQRQVKEGYAEPIRECVNRFIDDDTEQDKLIDKIEKLKKDLKGIKNDRENI